MASRLGCSRLPPKDSLLTIGVLLPPPWKVAGVEAFVKGVTVQATALEALGDTPAFATAVRRVHTLLKRHQGELRGRLPLFSSDEWKSC
jgi:hypothetical protein